MFKYNLHSLTQLVLGLLLQHNTQSMSPQSQSTTLLKLEYLLYNAGVLKALNRSAAQRVTVCLQRFGMFVNRGLRLPARILTKMAANVGKIEEASLLCFCLLSPLKLAR